MNYLVLWVSGAEDALAELWLNSTDRNRLAELSNQVDEILSAEAETCGKHLFDTVYEIEIGAFGVEYEVTAEDRHVRVMNVWDATKGRPDPKGN